MFYWLAPLRLNRRISSAAKPVGGFFLLSHTGDFWHDYNNMLSGCIKGVQPTKTASYGTVAFLEDLYGNGLISTLSELRLALSYNNEAVKQ